MNGRPFLAIIALVAGIALGAGVAHAAYGWHEIATPCVPSSIAMTTTEIAVSCPGERTIYVQAK